jgi:hypothetical protein
MKPIMKKGRKTPTGQHSRENNVWKEKHGY